MSEGNINALKSRSFADFQKYQDLPIAVYVTAESGEFVYHNSPTLDLFEIQQPQVLGNVIQYYSDGKERERLLEKFSKYNDSEWVKYQNLVFLINEERRKVRFCCKIYKNRDDLLGILCLVSQNEGFELSKPLEDSLPIGAFEMVNTNRISYANPKFLELFKVTPGTLKDLNIIKCIEVQGVSPTENEYILQKKKYTEIIKKLLKNKRIENEPIELKIGNDDFRVALMSIEIEEEHNNKIYKVKGLINDISINREYEGIHDSGFAVMVLERRSDKYYIRKVNKKFKELFDISPDENCVGAELSQIILDTPSIKEIEVSLSNIKGQDSCIVPIRKETSGVSVIELTMHVIKLNSTDFQRFYCAIYANVDEIEKYTRGLRNNFSSFLHSYAAMAENVKDTLRTIIAGHGTSAANNGQIDQTIVFEKIKGAISGFKSAYVELLNEIKNKNLENLDSIQIEHSLNEIDSEINLINPYNFNIPVETVRQNFIKIRRSIDTYSNINLINVNLIKRTRSEISEALRFSKLVSLGDLEKDAYDMVCVTQAFKDIIKLKEAIHTNASHNLIDGVEKAIRNLRHYASLRRLRISKKYNTMQEFYVKADSLGLYTVFYNILHNAIKYSFTKPNNEISPIIINIRSTDIFHEVSITNIGVGIPKLEIENGALFNFGNRGQSSRDRGRQGQGIGLWHCLNIVKQCRGEIKVSSEKIIETTVSTVPYKTTFTIVLPNASNKHG